MMGEYNRDVSFRKAMRKKRISDHYWSSRDHSYYDNLHQYSKNKIHCSCPLCRTKIKNKQIAGPTESWPMQAKRQFVDMDQQEEEENDEPGYYGLPVCAS